MSVTRDGIEAMMRRLLAVYPTMDRYLLEPESVAEWTNQLRGFNDDIVHDATTAVIAAHEHAPRIAVMVEACRVVAASDRYSRKAEEAAQAEIDRRRLWDHYESLIAQGIDPAKLFKPPGERPGAPRVDYGYSNTGG